MNSKYLFLWLLPFLLAACTREKTASTAMVMCGSTPVAEAGFNIFSTDPGFQAAHPVPLPLDTVFRGDMITFPVAGSDQAGRAYFVKAPRATDQYLLIFHEWWGLNDYVRRESDFWSDTLGVHVLAIDLYDGKVATHPETAGEYMRGVNRERALATIDGAAAFAGPGADFRTLGWCFGGSWSLQAALQLGDRAKACVMYYGMPVKEVEKLQQLSCSVLFIHASRDKYINDEVVAEFTRAMEAAGEQLAVHRYDADHAFANPSGARYREKAARESREVVFSYLNGK